MSVDHEREVCAALKAAKISPSTVDTPMLGVAVVGLLKETLGIPVSYVAHSPGEIRFNAGCVSFRLFFPPKARKVKLHYRHMESGHWLASAFDNRKNKANELLKWVEAHSIKRVPNPFI